MGQMKSVPKKSREGNADGQHKQNISGRVSWCYKKGKAEKVSGDEERGPQRQQIRT